MLSSCTKEQSLPQDEGLDATIMITAGTRAESFDPEDSYINSLRVLGYYSSNGKLAFNEKVTGFTANAIEVSKTITVKTGNFIIVVIANEHSDGSNPTDLSALLDKIDKDDAATNTMTYLTGLSFSHEAFSSTKDIPMVSVNENVAIYDNNTLVSNGMAYSTLPVVLERLAVRIDLTLQLFGPQVTAWQSGAHDGKVYFNNVPDKVYIIGGTDNSNNLLVNNEKFVTPVAGADIGTTKIFTSSRIILPESCLAELTESRALTIELYEGPTLRKGILQTGVGDYGYTLLRNSYFGITTGIGELSLTFDVNVIDWEDENMNHELQ